MNKFNKITKMGTILAVIVIGIGFSVYFLQEDAQLETYDGPPKALIIDQLYDEIPNEKFHSKATGYLEKAGYTVDIVTTKNVTIDFYKELPKMNYKFVVVRTHGAEDTNDVVLFTGKKYSEKEYIQEQLLGQVKKATPLREIAYKVDGKDSSEWIILNETTRYLKTSIKPTDETKNEYFAIASNFVSHGMEGKFHDTVFILGGCNTLSNPSLAQSLKDRGASLVVGWDNTVGSADNDHAILLFLKNLFVENKEMDQVLDELPTYVSQKRMVYPANFTYY